MGGRDSTKRKKEKNRRLVSPPPQHLMGVEMGGLAHSKGVHMIRVTVGKFNFRGTVHMTYTAYLRELARDGGKKYMDVYCSHGVESFRIKYMREVEACNG